ncbi:unnamed protein product [Psylliodes chrysocephalus]|uniref:Uncharacterized protein n=1 Tax=Psylliodes chrysocephalus TaxID=3402493 RepID=A0A9P0GKN2_9CUCU|nr:unnamed protein product [Psylliodes chrysocephala]
MSDCGHFKNLNVEINILNAQEVLEEKARKEWPQKWGFLLDFPKILLEEAAKRGISEEKYRQTMNRKKIKCIPYEKTITTCIEPTDYIPKTSSGYVGWRCESKYTLEKLGPLYVSPKHTLPYQPPYNCIMLG